MVARRRSYLLKATVVATLALGTGACGKDEPTAPSIYQSVHGAWSGTLTSTQFPETGHS